MASRKPRAALANKPRVVRVKRPETTKGRKKGQEREVVDAGLEEFLWEQEALDYSLVGTGGTV